MKVLIIGSGISGKSVYKNLKDKGCEVCYATDNQIKAKFLEKEELDRLFDGLSFIVISPGISPKIELIKQAKKRKIKVVGELEYGSSFLKGDVIAITGTNGKTTTVSLINHILSFSDYKVYLGGNIGTPVTEFASNTKEKDITILEVSSFQLETIKKFSSNIAVILNISEDHLNRHKTMKNYIKSKFNITKNQTEKDYLILNADDEILMQNKPKTKAQIFYFSTKNKVIGCYLKYDSIYFNDGLKEQKLISLKNFKLLGEHNKSNALCACLVIYLKLRNKKILSSVNSFQSVAHRIEFVKKINGVSFYNDSKATNIDSTIVALRSFKNDINLILGGSDKGYNFDEFFAKSPQNIKNIAIIGETTQKIAFSAKKYNFKNCYICKTLTSAVLTLFKLSKNNDIILLSPACASFDQFSNYEERGVCFKQIVREIEYENLKDLVTETT